MLRVPSKLSSSSFQCSFVPSKRYRVKWSCSARLKLLRNIHVVIRTSLIIVAKFDLSGPKLQRKKAT